MVIRVNNYFAGVPFPNRVRSPGFDKFICSMKAFSSFFIFSFHLAASSSRRNFQISETATTSKFSSLQ